ncbi:unnamed protein product, partial [Gulo gulo]
SPGQRGSESGGGGATFWLGRPGRPSQDRAVVRRGCAPRKGIRAKPSARGPARRRRDVRAPTCRRGDGVRARWPAGSFPRGSQPRPRSPSGARLCPGPAGPPAEAERPEPPPRAVAGSARNQRPARRPENEPQRPEERLKAAVHYTVGCLCEEVASDREMPFSKQTIAAISELTFRQCETFAKDLEMFARHAKRSTINTEDVKLLARRSNSLLKYITEKNEELTQFNTEQKAKKKKKLEDDNTKSVAAAAAADKDGS